MNSVMIMSEAALFPVTVSEIVLESDVDRDNPYLDVAVTAEFRGPDGETVRRPAFWDGGRTWRVRFAPTAPGIWRYRVEADDPSDGGLHGIEGVVEAGEADAAAVRRGFVRASSAGTHLERADGAPFFWLGDTHWRFAWERWDESNKPGWDSQFRGTVDLRVRQGFTVYQSNLMAFGRGWDAGTCWEDGAPYRRLVPEYFRSIIDPRMAYIADAGLVNAFAVGWYQAIDVDPEGVARFARYLVARYGAAPMVWTLGGEVAGYDDALRDERLRGWRDVALAIQDADDYRHPITAHLTNERPIADCFQGEDWLSLTLNQLGHGDLDMSPRAYAEHFAEHPGRPLVEGESMYEGITTVEAVGRRTATATIVRQVAYRAIQSGCCGYTYGAQGCWNGAWDAEDTATSWGDLPWHEGVELPGGAQMGHLRRFYESLPWWTLRPADGLFATTSGENDRFYRPLVTADETRRTLVAYFGETYRNDEGTASLGRVADAGYALRWFDPRAGEWHDAGAVRAERGSIPLPALPYDGADWLLVAQS